MKRFGLSGGIACGKSSVARLLENKGIPIIDADQVSRDIVAPNSQGLQEIVAAFGEDILTPQGVLNRNALGAIVMSDESKRKLLNRITHPKIYAQILERLMQLQHDGHQAAFVEAALMVETNSYTHYDALVIVTCAPEIQQNRLMAREGFTQETAEKWLASQLSLKEKEAVADFLIDNSGDREALQKSVDETWMQICRAFQLKG